MDTGIYYKLLSIVPSIGYNARVLTVDVKTRQAALEDTVMTIPYQNVDGEFLKNLNNINQEEVYKMDPGKYDLIIKSIIKTLDPDSSNEIKVTFLQWALARDKILKIFRKIKFLRSKILKLRISSIMGIILLKRILMEFLDQNIYGIA